MAGGAAIEYRFAREMGGAAIIEGIGSVREICTVLSMAERQQRQRLRALQNNRQLARFTVQGRATGKQLGTGSYGSVEEVWEGL